MPLGSILKNSYRCRLLKCLLYFLVMFAERTLSHCNLETFFVFLFKVTRFATRQDESGTTGHITCNFYVGKTPDVVTTSSCTCVCNRYCNDRQQDMASRTYIIEYPFLTTSIILTAIIRISDTIVFNITIYLLFDVISHTPSISVTSGTRHTYKILLFQ